MTRPGPGRPLARFGGAERAGRGGAGFDRAGARLERRGVRREARREGWQDRRRDRRDHRFDRRRDRWGRWSPYHGYGWGWPGYGYGYGYGYDVDGYDDEDGYLADEGTYDQGGPVDEGVYAYPEEGVYASPEEGAYPPDYGWTRDHGAWTYGQVGGASTEPADRYHGYGWSLVNGYWTYGEVDEPAHVLGRAGRPGPVATGVALSTAAVPPAGSCQVYDPATGTGVGTPLACDLAFARAPSGAWVIYRAEGEPRLVHGYAVDARSPGVPVRDLVFDGATGALLDELPA